MSTLQHPREQSISRVISLGTRHVPDINPWVHPFRTSCIRILPTGKQDPAHVILIVVPCYPPLF